jgi:hypothetical protein
VLVGEVTGLLLFVLRWRLEQADVGPVNEGDRVGDSVRELGLIGETLARGGIGPLDDPLLKRCDGC